MKLLTKAIREQLRKNYDDQVKSEGDKGWSEYTIDFKPVVKFFNPCGAATWLITELASDGDTMFGLCDLGMGSPELGYVSLKELSEVRVKPFGLGIEREIHWKADKTLSAYADEAREKGRLIA